MGASTSFEFPTVPAIVLGHTALHPLTKGNARHYNLTLSKNDDCRGEGEGGLLVSL